MKEEEKEKHFKVIRENLVFFFYILKNNFDMEKTSVNVK